MGFQVGLSNGFVSRRAMLLLAASGWGTWAQAQTDPFEEAIRRLKEISGSDVRDFSTQDFGRERYPGGRSALVPKDAAEGLLTRLRDGLRPGVIAFVGVTNSLARPAPNGVELVVAKGQSQFDILRVAGTDGSNYQLDTERLVQELES